MTKHLDHTGLVARDLESAAAQYRALGFNLTPRSEHAVPNPDGTLRPAGTANHCAMLERGYLEIVAVTDPGASSFSRTQIGNFTARFEGIHLLAIGTRDAAATAARLNAGGHALVEPRDLRREIKTGGQRREAQFRLIVLPRLSGPDVTFFFIEHRTRELLWTPGSTAHPNGATGLCEVVVVANEIEAARGLYETAFGLPAAELDGGLSFELEESAFLVLTPAAAGRHYGASLPTRALPHCAGQAVEVGDLAATAAELSTNGVPFLRSGGRLTVTPAFAGGSFLQFVERGR
jgi:hypothetical protein